MWPWHQINRHHLLFMTNHHTKFEVPRPKHSIVIDRKLFLPTRSMWPWPLTPKSIGAIYWSWPITIPSLKFLGLSVLLLSLGNHLVYGQTDKCKAPPPPSLKWGHNYLFRSVEYHYPMRCRMKQISCLQPRRFYQNNVHLEVGIQTEQFGKALDQLFAWQFQFLTKVTFCKV
jgi:hypothetical protein